MLHGDQILIEHSGVVVGFAIFAAGYSSIRHFATDKTLRLARTGKAGKKEEHH
jgi:hypothetical protein